MEVDLHRAAHGKMGLFVGSYTGVDAPELSFGAPLCLGGGRPCHPSAPLVAWWDRLKVVASTAPIRLNDEFRLARAGARMRGSR